MTRLSSAFGDVSALRIKQFTLGNHTFKVRVPLSSEMEAIQQRINDVDPAKIEAKYVSMSQGFRDNPSEGVTITDDDVIVGERSTREMARTILTLEQRVTEFIRLLVPEKGSLDDLTYEEIEAEWPLAVQLEMIEHITEAVQPGYKEQRKN